MLFRLAVLVCFTCVLHVQATVLNVYPTPDTQWSQVDSDVVLTCDWEHDSASRVQVTWKNENNAGLRRIVENDVNGSYVYLEAEPEGARQREVHDFGEDAAGGLKSQSSELTILNISLTDSTTYHCTVEVGAGEKEETATFQVSLYAIPTVTTVDQVISVDIRPPIEVESANETEIATATNETDADTAYDYNYGNEEATEQEQKIIINCVIDGAFPQPTIVFRVAEGEPMAATDVNWVTGAEEQLYSGTATLELDADPKYDGKSVTCYAVLPTTPETEVKSDEASSPIEILHEVSMVTTKIVPDVAIAGEEVQIRCDSDGNPKPTFSVETNVAEKPLFDPSEDGKTFTIPSVIKGDAGQYYCVATLPSRSDDDTETTTKQGDTMELQVHYIEAPTLSETAITLAKGGSRTINCNGNGNPLPNAVWKKGGSQLDTVNGALVINSAVYGDEGTYTCETSNAAGTESEQLHVSVEGGCVGRFRDTVISDSQVSDQSDHFFVKLECEVTGQPECEVDIVSQAGFELQGTKKENGRVLEFDSMPKLSSPVTFFCISTNEIGKSNVSVTLGQDTVACCAEPVTAGLSVGAIIGIILLVVVVLVGIPVACYFVKKRNAPPKKAPEDAEAAEPEKESLNKDASSEDSDTGSLPPPPADMDNDHRLNHGAHEMTTFSSNQ